MERLFDSVEVDSEPELLYCKLTFPSPPLTRPYTIINMVSSVDGKILVGPIGSTAMGLGGPTDQLLMRRIQSNVDAVMIGAGTLRPGNVVYDPKLLRIVVSRSGDLPLVNRFFTDAPEKVIVILPRNAPNERFASLQQQFKVLQFGDDIVELRDAVKCLREDFGVRNLAVEGGADLNFQFLNCGLVDEFFMTLAPKIKGGKEMPTPVEGAGFPDWEYLNLKLLSLYRDENELYFRYRVLGTNIK